MREAQQRRLLRFKFNWGYAIAYFIIAGPVPAAWYILSHLGRIDITIAMVYGVVGSTIGIILYSSFTLIMVNYTSAQLWRTDFQISQLGGEDLKSDLENDIFTKLVQINFKYIDQYYFQTQEQAAKSFRLAVFACATGFLVLILGVLITYFREGDDKIAGYVTTGAGLITQFISAIFFYLYNQTVLKMSQYHQKLVSCHAFNFG